MKKNDPKQKTTEINRKTILTDLEKNLRSISLLRHFDTQTPLFAPRAQILIEIKDQGYLHQPNPMKASLMKRDKRKYCHYQRDHDHDTEECWQLKDKIEIMIH